MKTAATKCEVCSFAAHHSADILGITNRIGWVARRRCLLNNGDEKGRRDCKITNLQSDISIQQSITSCTEKPTVNMTFFHIFESQKERFHCKVFRTIAQKRQLQTKNSFSDREEKGADNFLEALESCGGKWWAVVFLFDELLGSTVNGEPSQARLDSTS